MSPPGMFDFAFFPLFLFLLFWIVSFLLALLFVYLAARLGARAVLDEIAKDRERRQRP